MSGDLGPRVAISASQKFITLFPDVDLVLVGDQAQIHSLYSQSPELLNRIIVVQADDVVRMNDDPLVALRQKKSSSMWVALDALRKDHADACVSAGNTGALLAMSKFLIKTVPGIERPAICKSMSVEQGGTYLLDLGANLNCSPVQLHQFALMGAVLAVNAEDPECARVALLNVGVEDRKGTDVLREAQTLLKADARFNYVGFVEADGIFSGAVDVIVCDGFNGNIALKASEGVARFIAKKVQAIIQQNFMTKIIAFLASPLLICLRNELDPSSYNGAIFLGLQKVVIKSHGSADERAFLNALIVAREQVIQQVPARIKKIFIEH